MSIIHVNQIKNHVMKVFELIVDLSDLLNPSPESRESFLLTRSLAAYAIQYLSGASPEAAVQCITDGGNDNGIDALYYDEPSKRLYFVQSKWIKDGVGEPDNGDVKKFIAGVHDLFNLRFDRFNQKIVAKQGIITAALDNPSTRYEVVLAYTGSSKLATPSSRDLEDLATEMNDTSEVLFITVLNQSELHKSLAIGIAGEPINVPIGLKKWGRKEGPHEAFYGQVTGDQVAEWWQQYRQRLFAKNLRGTLGETDVNTEMRETLENRPELFWYFNNGITMVARVARRSMAGGADTDFSTFHCEDVNIVNGAQTVSTLGKFRDQNLTGLNNVIIPMRIIVRGNDQSFADDVTRTNNRQNRIDNRDFVTLDPEQSRIRTELAIDGIDYQIMRTESVVRSETAFGLVEATTALACASGKIKLAVQLKREIGKLWEDIAKAPYKELFNASVPGVHVWRCVQVQRLIDKSIETYFKRSPSGVRSFGLRAHGNRIIAALVFEVLPVAHFKDSSFRLDSIKDDTLNSVVDKRLELLSNLLEFHYPNSIIPTLFKNLKKCEHLVKEAKVQLQGNMSDGQLGLFKG